MNSNSLFISILGNKNTNTIDRCYQVTNGILVNNLARLFNIEKKQVKIFAYGDKHDYDFSIHTNNKLYHQFGLNDVFQIDASSYNFDFNYFYDFKDVWPDIDDLIQKSKYTAIILFLENHISKGKFSRIDYFQLYQIFLKYPERNFLVFIDSYFSGSFIYLIETYNKIYELKIHKQIDNETCLQLIFSFTKLFKSILKCKKRKYSILDSFCLIDLYQKNKIDDQNRFKKVFDLLSSNDKSVEKIKEIGFQGIEEFDNFQFVYNTFHLNKKLSDNDKENYIQYQKSLEVFTTTNMCTIIKMINNDLPKYEDSEDALHLQKFMNAVNIPNLQEFINAMDFLEVNRESINFELPPSQNIEIITSTDDKSKCFSYVSIRANRVTKVYPGSPAISEFMKEIFMKNGLDIISFDKIKNEMCGTKENTIYYSVRVQKKSSSGHIKKEWANLFPQHYKSSKENLFSLSFSEEAKRKIATLRAISFIISKRFNEISTNLSSELDPNAYNINNDPIADMVAIAAIIPKGLNINEIMNKSINANKFFKEQDLLGIEIVSSIVQFAFFSKKDHVQMMAVIMNCINEAILKEISKNIDSISENDSLKFISNKESSYFIKNSNNKQIIKKDNKDDNEQNEDKIKMKEYQKLEIVDEIRNAVFALLNPTSSFFAYIIASSIFDDIDIESIINSDFMINSSKINKLYQVFLQNITSLKEVKFRKLAENYFFSHVKLALQTLNSICDMHIKNDAMEIVASGLQNQNSLFLIQILAQNIDSNETFITNIIEPIENIISSQKISSFFIPAILELILPKHIISLLYASFLDLQNNWFENAIDILKKTIHAQNTPNNIMNYQYIDEKYLLSFANDALNEAQNIHDKSVYEAEVFKIKENYKREINLSIKKINKLNDISVKRVRGNISRMMNMKILENRIKYNYRNFFNVQNNYHDKFHEYLYSSISNYLNEVKTYKNYATLDQNSKEEFDDIGILKNTDDLYKRAARELNTVAYLFSLSDQSLDDSINELSKQIKSDELIFQIDAMFARALNVVEMSPIECLLEFYGSELDPNQVNNPNIKEIMGLLGGNIFILSEKDKKRKRTKFECTKNILTKDKEGNEERSFECEYDSYYSNDDDDFEDAPTKRSHNMQNKLQKRIWHKNQLSQFVIRNIQEKFKIGSSDWTYEAWIAFVYCFNERMKDIKLQFNPDDEYENDICYCSINEAKSIIDSFYPLYRIIDFTKNEYKIQLFVGKNMNHAKEIFRAMIRAFDDTDRVVTPRHMFRETYEQRTLEVLNTIFNY